MIRAHRGGKVLAGLFSFDSAVPDEAALPVLQGVCGGEWAKVVDLACLGKSRLVHFWYEEPSNHRRTYKKWHLYQLEDIAFGYFLHNIIHSLIGQSVDENIGAWFPSADKEIQKIREIDLVPAADGK